MNAITVYPPSYTDYYGSTVSVLKAYGFIIAGVKAENKSSTVLKATLIFALYSKTGAVKTLAFVEKLLGAGSMESLNAGFSLPSVIDGMYCKVFVWDNLSKMTPLSPVFRFPAT